MKVHPVHDETRPAPTYGVEPLVVQMFGQLGVRVGGKPLPAMRTRTERDLLALLLLHCTEPRSREWVAEQIWPDAERAGTWLSEALSRIRSLLGPVHGRRIQRYAHKCIRIDLSGAAVDLAEFDAGIAEGSKAGLARAVAAYHGPLLDGCSGEWVLAERSRREESLLYALETLAEHRMRAGHAREAVALLRRGVGIDPIRESLHLVLMRALEAAGDPAAALRAYHALRRRMMAENLPIAPALTRHAERLRSAAKRRRGPSAASPSARSSAVPGDRLPHPLTALVGREDDLREVLGRLRCGRLTTIAGMGGVGKTRLAIEVGRRYATEEGIEAGMSALDAVRRPEALPHEALRALGIRQNSPSEAIDTFAAHLRHGDALLILDNCEHLLDACGRLATELLQRCPGLRILATSRQPLGIPGEAVWRLGSLETHGSDVDGTASSATGPAVRLFAERARAAEQTFVLDDASRPVVASICDSVGGLPLAIELAAARARPQGLSSLADSLRRSLAPLEGAAGIVDRHRSVDALVGWSYALLSEADRRLLVCLSVFEGGFTDEGAAHVCGDAHEGASNCPASLVERSLVMRVGQGSAARYAMHELVRRHARHLLDSGRDPDGPRDRHLGYFVDLARRAAGFVNTHDEAEWLNRLHVEHANLRSALEHSLAASGRLGAGLRLGAALQPYWELRGFVHEALWFYERAIDRAREPGGGLDLAEALRGAGVASMGRSDARGRTWLAECVEILERLDARDRLGEPLLLLGRIAESQNQFAEARRLVEASLASCRASGDQAGELAAVLLLGRLAHSERRFSEAVRVNREALAPARELGARLPEAIALLNMGRAEVARGRRSAGDALLGQGMALLRSCGAARPMAVWMNILGDLAIARGDVSGAVASYEEGLEAFRAQNNPRGVAWTLTNLGNAAREDGRTDEAAELLRESLQTRCALDDLRGVADTLIALAELAVASSASSGHEAPRALRRAARLYGAADRLYGLVQTPVHSTRRRAYERWVREARRGLGLRSMRREWSIGARWSLDEAIAAAMEP